MTVKDKYELEGLKAIGTIVHDILYLLRDAICPGITTKELDQIAEKEFTDRGARSAPMVAYNFPGYTCISVNNEAAHGIPSSRILKEGDIVNIDVSGEKDGFYADTGSSFAVGEASPEAKHLLDVTKSALKKALFSARAGQKISDVGKKVERIAKTNGLKVVENIGGHGVGRSIHEEPSVLNYYTSETKDRFHEGQVIAIEPILSLNSNHCVEQGDGWTLACSEGDLVAQFEHSIVITKGAPIILT